MNAKTVRLNYLFNLENVMKKVILMLAVIAMAAPLYAADPCDVVFDGDGSGGILVLSYTTNNGALPRGIGLKCEVLGIDTVDVDSGAVVTDPCFNTFIDYAFMDPCNFTIGAGHPMADPCFAGVLDPCDAVDVFSICMGVLDQTGGKNAGPATSASLISIPLTSTADSVTIRISEDPLRGGVVGSALTTNLPIDVTVTFVTDCYVVGQPRGNSGDTITQANYDAWEAAGKPEVWCCPFQPCGDANGDGYVNSQDYLPIGAKIGTTASENPREDINHDGFVNSQDYLPVSANIGQGDGVICPPLP